MDAASFAIGFIIGLAIPFAILGMLKALGILEFSDD